VFSEHTTMLEMIANLLEANKIKFYNAKTVDRLKKKIDSFKNEPDTNVLLMPYSFGANGLNIIEATHVLLVEPTLNKSQEVQAIGRVHRIGQTKATFVYRFLVRNTIEELVYSLFKSNTSYGQSEPIVNANQPNTSRSFERLDNEPRSSSTAPPEKIIKIDDLKELFLNL
jgi:SNF2 family DNA or RNA helicase